MISLKKTTTTKVLSAPKLITAPVKNSATQISKKRASICPPPKKTLANAFNTKSAALLKEPTNRKSYCGGPR